MIEFKLEKTHDKAHEQMVQEMVSIGFPGEDAQRLADAACSITLTVMRSTDELIKAESTDELDRTVIQQLMLHQLMGISKTSLQVNATHMMIALIQRMSGL